MAASSNISLTIVTEAIALAVGNGFGPDCKCIISSSMGVVTSDPGTRPEHYSTKKKGQPSGMQAIPAITMTVFVHPGSRSRISVADVRVNGLEKMTLDQVHAGQFDQGDPKVTEIETAPISLSWRTGYDPTDPAFPPRPEAAGGVGEDRQWNPTLCMVVRGLYRGGFHDREGPGAGKTSQKRAKKGSNRRVVHQPSEQPATPLEIQLGNTHALEAVRQLRQATGSDQLAAGVVSAVGTPKSVPPFVGVFEFRQLSEEDLGQSDLHRPGILQVAQHLGIVPENVPATHLKVHRGAVVTRGIVGVTLSPCPPKADGSLCDGPTTATTWNLHLLDINPVDERLARDRLEQHSSSTIDALLSKKQSGLVGAMQSMLTSFLEQRKYVHGLFGIPCMALFDEAYVPESLMKANGPHTDHHVQGKGTWASQDWLPVRRSLLSEAASRAAALGPCHHATGGVPVAIQSLSSIRIPDEVPTGEASRYVEGTPVIGGIFTDEQYACGFYFGSAKKTGPTGGSTFFSKEYSVDPDEDDPAGQLEVAPPAAQAGGLGGRVKATRSTPAQQMLPKKRSSAPPEAMMDQQFPFFALVTPGESLQCRRVGGYHRGVSRCPSPRQSARPAPRSATNQSLCLPS
jgi:hypothetical protein